MTDSDRSAGQVFRKRGTCAFCDKASDYVLGLSDSAPDPEKVVESEIALPICRNHLQEAKEANINA